MAQNVLAKVAVEIAANVAGFNAGLARAENRLNSFEGKIKKASAALLGAFALADVGRQILDVTSNFQKFEAVLTNTLGSNSAAQAALDSIRDFALNTPFEVSEITAAYVRWQNLGLTPTIAKMRMLGDVASSLGAGFEQTAEAFKDLAVGQTKRLEEIGISATQQNGKIQLSFKGVNLEIEKNAQGVEKALETYSQLNGVLGSTDAVSKTLGGRISNLKDAWDNLLLTLGQGNSGILYNIIQTLTDLAVVSANAGVELEIFGRRTAYTLGTIATAGVGEELASKLVEFNNLSQDAQEYLLRLGNTASGKKVSDVLGLVEQGKSAKQLLEDKIDLQKRFNDTFLAEGETQKDINNIFNLYLKKLNERYKIELQSGIESTRQAGLAADQARKEQSRIDRLKKQEEEKKIAAEAEKMRFKDAQDAWNEMMRERSKTLKDLEKQINIIGQGLAYRYAGAEAFNVKPLAQQLGGDEKGMLPIPPGMTEQIANYQKEIAKANQSNAVFSQGVAELNNAFGQAAAGGIADFLTGLGDVAARQLTFGQLILESIGKFMKQFGAALIQMGIAKMALNKLFSTPAGAAVAIAAGTALVALGGIVSKSAAKQTSRMGNGSGGGGGTGFSSQTVSAQNIGSTISITGELKGSGRDLVAVINQTSFDNKVRKGG